MLHILYIYIYGAGRSSSGRALAYKGWDNLIEPAWWMHLQCGLFSVPTSDPQLVKLWYVMSCLWENACKKLLFLISSKESMWRQQVPSKEICHSDLILMSNSWGYNKQYALEAPLNKTNFYFLYISYIYYIIYIIYCIIYIMSLYYILHILYTLYTL